MSAKNLPITPSYWAEACTALSAADPVMAKLIARYPGEVLQSRGEAFPTLARSIVGQQISVKAAQSVWERFVALFDTGTGTENTLTPHAVLQKTTDELRSAGLSARKAEYMHSLAEHFDNGSLSIAQWHSMPDEAIIAELTQIRGIGRWTAEMFLMFCLLRPNVLPLDDIGLLKAVEQLYPDACQLPPDTKAEAKTKNTTAPTLAQQRKHTAQVTRQIAQQWQPWCSVATWYLWRHLDPLPVNY